MGGQQALQQGTYAHGMAVVIGFVVAVFVAICLLDFLCSCMGWPSIGYRVQRWSRKNPLYVSVLVLVVAMLLTHIVGNPIHYT